MGTEPGIVSLGRGRVRVGLAGAGTRSSSTATSRCRAAALPADRFGGGVAEVVTDYGGGVTLFAGHGSVATPGAVPRASWRSRSYGALPWADVVAPPRRPAATATPSVVRPRATSRSRPHSLFGRDPEALRVVTRPDGSAVGPATSCTNHALAEMLDLVAAEGASVLTPARSAGRWSTTWPSTGPRDRTRPRGVHAAGPAPCAAPSASGTSRSTRRPSVGGPMLAVMLGELQRRGNWHWPRHHRHPALGAALPAPRARLRPRPRRRRPRAAASVDRHGLTACRRARAPPTSRSSTRRHRLRDHRVAAATARASRARHRILLNNALGEPELNRLGAAPRSHPAPGSRRTWRRPPAASGDGRVLAIGSPGADRITTALMLVLGQGCLHDADLRHAIEAPRLHVRFDDDGSPSSSTRRTPRSPPRSRGRGCRAATTAASRCSSAGVGAAYRREDGVLQAAGDPRREAAVEVLDVALSAHVARAG